MEDYMKKNREVICGAAALLAAASFFVGCLQIPIISKKISSLGNINILVYGMSLILFCAFCIIGLVVVRRMKPSSHSILESVWVKGGMLVLLLVGQAVFFIVGVSQETQQVGSVAGRYGWHTQPLWLMAALFFVELAAFFWIYRKITVEEKCGEWLLYVLYAVLTILVFYSMDTPNIFGRGEWGDSYHAHAYFNSIYNVHWGMPYTAELTSIYGHYALLWKLPMKLIGGDFRMFVLLMAALGAISHLCAFLTIHQVIKSRVFRGVAAIACAFPILGMRGGYYWQLWPHRMIFPAIMMLYAVTVLRKKKFGWKTALSGYLICMLGVIWNTETGMILAAAWAAVHICYLFSEGACNWKRIGKYGIFHLAGVAGSFAGAYGLVNLYNILKHSPVNTLKEFMVPLMSDAYMTDVLHLDLPMYPSAYMAEVTLFLIGVFLGIAGWRWFREKGTEVPWKKYLLFFVCISALGRLVYYMNRPAYHNLDCCHFSAVLLLAYLCEQGLWMIRKGNWKQWRTYSFERIVKSSIGVVCGAALIVMATGTALQFSQNSEIKENFHNQEELDQFLQTVEQQIPANTFAFGLNVAEIYSMLHWNTQCFTMDFSDMFVAQDSAKQLVEQMQQGVEQVFTSSASLPILEQFHPEGYQWFMETYTLDKSLSIQGTEFQFYVRK